MIPHPRKTDLRRLASGGVLIASLALAVTAMSGCSRSLGEFQTTSTAKPMPLAPATAALPPTVAAEQGLPPIALVPEDAGVPVATMSDTAAQLPPSDEATGTVDGKRRLLTPEEKARIIAELEALARQQAHD